MPLVDWDCACGGVLKDEYTPLTLSEVDKEPPKCPDCGKLMERSFTGTTRIDTKADHPRFPRPDERLKVKNKSQEAQYEREVQRGGDSRNDTGFFG